ncbi:regulator [Streptomyces sp. YC537]|uniref:Regulator n=2 Tax=Streptomyces boluensis TaxID=1775135 RepID=A0A964UMD5_9ACTN|nr:regulator [Streptomyces boluensis]
MEDELSHHEEQVALSGEFRTMTLEAYADTIIPGEKRGPEDRAIAGVATGGGAVQAGALELLAWDATGIHDGLDDLARLLNEHTTAYAEEQGLELDADVPPFVALGYEHRAELVLRLTKPGHPEKDFWVMLALFCNMAFDSAAHLPTQQALQDGHPGLAALGISKPDPDGLWRFTDFGYGRELARMHPDTTPSGSPA